MTLQHQIGALYNNDLRAWHDDATAIIDTGHVLSSDTFELWGFPCNEAEVMRCGYAQIRIYENPDAWFVWLAAGDIKDIIAAIPYPLPRVIFARDNGRLRAYDLRRLTTLAQHVQQKLA